MELPEDDSLRSRLIREIAVYQGWEESAIAMVDDVIMPIINENNRYYTVS